MHNRSRLIAVLVASSTTGAVLAALTLAGAFPAAFRASVDAVHDHVGASAPSAPTFYSEMVKVNARMHQGMAVVPTGDIDRDFMRMMIPHHQGAIDMALVLLKYGHDEKLKRLAQSIIVEQGQEITYMRLLDPPRTEQPEPHHAANK
jgi:uncharacterized protein (DUF305 family)